MGYYEGLNDLRDMFAELYPTESKARVVVGEAGISDEFINFGGSAIEFWRNILEFAQNNGQVQKVIDVARKRYPGNSQLAEAEIVFHETPVPSTSIANDRDHVQSNPRQGAINVEGGNNGVIAGGNVTDVEIIHVGDISGNGNQIGSNR